MECKACKLTMSFVRSKHEKVVHQFKMEIAVVDWYRFEWHIDRLELPIKVTNVSRCNSSRVHPIDSADACKHPEATSNVIHICSHCRSDLVVMARTNCICGNWVLDTMAEIGGRIDETFLVSSAVSFASARKDSRFFHSRWIQNM